MSNVAITSSAGSDRTYGVDEIIEVTVTFDETVVITGTPELTLDVGGRKPNGGVPERLEPER